MNHTAQRMATLDGLLRSALERARTITHSGEQGSQAEQAWLTFLGGRLPNRYAVARGELFDAEGQASEQQDVVIFDAQYSPLVFGEESSQIVAESVYAVIEVKPDLTAAHFDYARDKAASARAMARTSVPIYHAGGQFPPKPPVRQLAALVADRSGWAVERTAAHVSRHLGQTEAADDPRALDLVYADGIAASHLVSPETGNRELLMHTGDGAIAWFLVELLRGLSHLGTVAAIDFGVYREAITG